MSEHFEGLPTRMSDIVEVYEDGSKDLYARSGNEVEIIYSNGIKFSKETVIRRIDREND